jgi:hypothetical protein
MKKVIICTLLATGFLGIVSCKSKKDMRSTPELERVFTKDELKDINTIVDFYEERLKKQAQTNQLDTAFYKFGRHNIHEEFFDFSGFDHKSLQQLYKNIHPKTYQEIWEENPGYHFVIKDSIKMFNAVYDQKFMRYLKIVGNKNPKIKSIQENFEASGSIQYLVFHTLYQDFDDDGYNARLSKKIGDFNNRFICAVFTIIVIENYYRDKIIDERRATMKPSDNRN